ncbi:hypothetical protein Drorol1_Dr00002452 [Drosera rotundifolia]
MEILKNISFLAHSLGGLFARHAVGILYSARNMNAYKGDDPSKTDGFQRSGTIAGLEPINFVTLATPHLGVRGRKQECKEEVTDKENWFSLTSAQQICDCRDVWASGHCCQ